MVIALVSTSNRSTHCHLLVVALDGRTRKRVVREPGFTPVIVEPVWFSLKTRATRNGFGLHSQNYPSTCLWRVLAGVNL